MNGKKRASDGKRHGHRGTRGLPTRNRTIAEHGNARPAGHAKDAKADEQTVMEEGFSHFARPLLSIIPANTGITLLNDCAMLTPSR